MSVPTTVDDGGLFGAYASPWQPAALGLPPVNYPGAAPARRQRMRYVPAQPTQRQQTPEEVFGVNAGGWNPNPMGWNNAGPLDPRIYKTTNIPVGGGGGAGGGGGLAQSFQDAIDRANQANEARYRDILGGYQSRYQRGMGMLSGLGQQEARDINELYDNQAAQARQNLTSRGLGNSTLLATMQQGADRERNAELGRLNERMRQQTLATDSGLSGDTLQFMERKNDTGPNLAMLAQLAQGVGAAGGGGGGMGPVYASPGSLGYVDPSMFYTGGGYQSPYAGFSDARNAQARAARAARNANPRANLPAGFDPDWYYGTDVTPPQSKGLSDYGSRAAGNWLDANSMLYGYAG